MEGKSDNMMMNAMEICNMKHPGEFLSQEGILVLSRGYLCE